MVRPLVSVHNPTLQRTQALSLDVSQHEREHSGALSLFSYERLIVARFDRESHGRFERLLCERKKHPLVGLLGAFYSHRFVRVEGVERELLSSRFGRSRV
jgi:hypothetical protein